MSDTTDLSVVLRPVRSAGSNARSTGVGSAGSSSVSRMHGPTGSLVLPPITVSTGLVELGADQYRTVHSGSVGSNTEYLLWCRTGGSLGAAGSVSCTGAIGAGGGLTVTGLLPVATYGDGTSLVVVTGTAGSTIGGVSSLTVSRGDGVGSLVFSYPADFAVDVSGGLGVCGVELGAGALVLLGGGLSSDRGDTVLSVVATGSVADFHWSRNDSAGLGRVRFGWQGVSQRWAPLPGGPVLQVVSRLDMATVGSTGYSLLGGQGLSGWAIDTVLPSGLVDGVSLFRIGRSPSDDAGVGLVVRVVSDSSVSTGTGYTGSFLVGEDGVVGASSGVLVLNPASLTVQAGGGLGVWFQSDGFSGVGVSQVPVGPLQGSDSTSGALYLSPLPLVGLEYPLIRVGNRRYLTAVRASADADLAALVVPSGSVGWSGSSGRLKFADSDVAKSDPTDTAGFELGYLGAMVWYDGVSCVGDTGTGMGTGTAIALVDSAGLPVAVGASNELFLPLSTGGVGWVPDGSGVVPDVSVLVPQTRPNGSGLVRSVPDTGFLFSGSQAVAALTVVEFESELPVFRFAVGRGQGYVSLEESGSGPAGASRVVLGAKDRKLMAGEQVYYLDPQAEPSVLVPVGSCLVYGRIRSGLVGGFSVVGTEKLAFSVDGIGYLWLASSLGAVPGTYSATDVAASIQAVMGIGGTCTATWDGRLVLSGGSTVEIGWGTLVSGLLADRDLSGCMLLGLLPGWRTNVATDDWLSDSGVRFGLSRSPVNLDRVSGTAADYQAYGSFSDAVIQRSVIASSVVSLGALVPLEDVPGYGDGIYFQYQGSVGSGQPGVFKRDIRPYQEAVYQFSDGLFYWAVEDTIHGPVHSPTETLQIGSAGQVVADSLYPTVPDSSGGHGLFLSESGGARTLQTVGSDYLVLVGGSHALLSTDVGGLVVSGDRGTVTSGLGTFTDLNATFVTDGVGVGFRLSVSGSDNSGEYLVLSVDSETQITVTPEFADSDTDLAWSLYRGYADTVYDPGVLAREQYASWSHLTAEPFTVRLLSGTGPVPPDKATQSLGRLTAVVAGALENSRTMRLRMGLLSDSVEQLLFELSMSQLGSLTSQTGSVLDSLPVTDPYFLLGAFSVVVGDREYTIGGGDLIGVLVFTDPDLHTADTVEYGLPGSGLIEGQLQFGAQVVTDRQDGLVYYSQTFTDPDLMGSGTVELRPSDGSLNFSSVDMATYAGVSSYFVETMNTDRSTGDVVISPLQGSVYFRTPLRSGQITEVSYWQADVTGALVGSQITEQLPLYVRQEVATWTSDTEWAINPTGRTIRTDIAVQAWVNDRLQNYGLHQNQGALSGSAFVFSDGIGHPSSGTRVSVSYAVSEAFGGEQSFTTSTTPVYRPPFSLSAGSDSFVLDGDRTGDMVAGKLLRLGPVPFYLTGSVYDAVSDQTTVSIYPPPISDVGSMSPGADVLSLLTTGLIAGNTGFLLSLAAVPYAPADRGMTEILFLGDVTQYAVPGHLLDVAGYPHLIAAANRTADGRATSVTLTTALERGFDPSVDEIKISVRPIYPPGAMEFLGVGVPLPRTEPVLVRFHAGNAPGTILTPDIDYVLDRNTGGVRLLAPWQTGLAGTEELRLYYLRARQVSPVLLDTQLIVPSYSCTSTQIVTPDSTNGYLGSVVLGKYSYRSPDTFYCRVVSLSDYLPEVAIIAIDRVQAQAPHGGPMVVSQPEDNNWDHGTTPIWAEVRDLKDQDRAARSYIGLYDSLIVGFEQVLETIDGRVIGDRDGKFKFFVGTGKTYAGPGYEDSITGYLDTGRLVWSDVFEAGSGSFGVSTLDPLVDPETAALSAGLVVSGSVMNPWLLDFYINKQRDYVLNDIDDVILRGPLPPVLTGPPLGFTVYGDYAAVWEPSVISRLYPESTLAFTTTYPGLLSGTDILTEPGRYSFLTMITPPKISTSVSGLAVQGPVFGSTFGKDIGSLTNPALGPLTGVTGQVRMRERLPRARVWGYRATGYPELGGPSVPTVLASIVPLSEVPLDPDTGLPDLTQLASLANLSTGDVLLSTPAWYSYDSTDGTDSYPQVAFGRPDGSLYSVGAATGLLSDAFSGGYTFSPSISKGVFVDSVLFGCLITFTDGDNQLTKGTDIVRVGLDGATDSFEPVYGDTIYVIPPMSADASTFSDPPTAKELRKFAKNQPFLDVGVRERRSTIVDRSLPSAEDPAWPIKEITNQRTAKPLQTVEADVEFTNTSQHPQKFPALLGLTTNDSGDYGIPYLSSPNTELERLGLVQGAFVAVVQADNVTNTAAVYPDEILATDGTVLAVGSDNPATLISASSTFLPLGVYTPHSGVGNVAEFGLLLVQPGTGFLPEGATGILSVGSVSATMIQPPRFVSPTLLGDKVRFTFDHAMTHLTSTGLSGMVISEVGPNTILDITSVGGLFLNDGSATVGVGGLNTLVAGTYVENRLVFDLLDQTTGLVLETLTYDGVAPSTLTSSITGTVFCGAPVFSDKQASFPVVGVVSTLGTQTDFSLSIDTYNTGTGLEGSDGAVIGTDRLTFSDNWDMRGVLPRGSVTVGLVSVEGQLRVRTVTATGLDTCTINDINGAVPLPFLARDTLLPDSIGTFDPDPGTGRGSVTVMAFESNGNVPIVSTGDVTFSAVPMAAESATGFILSGTGTVTDGLPALTVVTAGTGDLANVTAGDVVTVTATSASQAAVTAGTYLVRHSVPETAPGYYQVSSITTAGTNGGWASSPFPRITGVSLGSLTASGATLLPLAMSASGCTFPAAGYLYLILNPNDLNVCIRVTYTALVLSGPDGTDMTFTWTLGTAVYGDGTPLASNIAFMAACANSTMLSGMVYLPVANLLPSSIADNNVVGYDNGVTTVGGFTTVALTHTGSVPYVSGAALVDSTAGVPAADQVGVWVSGAAYPAEPSNFYYADRATVIYSGVPFLLDISTLTQLGSWDTIHGVVNPIMLCLIPGDQIEAQNYQALAGVFLEPSVPIQAQDLGGLNSLVVDSGHSGTLALNQVGMRDINTYLGVTTETVSYTVYRVRRFHDVLTGISANLNPLRYCYETRTGTVALYAPATRTLSLTGTGTNLGGLDSTDVNVQPGDTVRILDTDGITVLDQAEVAGMIDATSLRLRTPGFSDYVPVGGETLDIRLRHAPVPQTQSNEQLLEQFTASVLRTSTADYTTGAGAYVSVLNELRDTTVADWTLLDITEGDILLVDPAGTLAGPTGPALVSESGSRPIGDQSVSVRVDGSYIAGGPSQLDDNRGWYRVAGVFADHLLVTGVTEFSGASGSPVIFGDAGQEFAVLPDITGSGLPAGLVEGQMDLRVTQPAGASSGDPNSYLGNYDSVQPFSYRIIRPTSIVGTDTVDFVLLMRERMLSWLEELGSSTDTHKSGDYYTFQTDQHISTLGSVTDPTSGYGVPSNLFITSLSGLTEFAPFANTSDCLSVLDRRYWCLDLRLDSTVPPYDTVGDTYSSFETDNSASGYTVGSGRPVLPDRVTDVLDRTDRLRDQRYSWIKFRTDRVTGTLPQITRWYAELPNRLSAQEELLRLLSTFSLSVT